MVRKPNCAGSAPVRTRDAAQRAGVEDLAEAGQALGQGHAVQPVLQVAVLAADMHLAEAVLHHAGGLQQDLVERLGAAAGQRLDRLALHHRLAAAEAGEDALPRRGGALRLDDEVGQGGLGRGLGGDLGGGRRGRAAGGGGGDAAWPDVMI